ncbi:hypothetical protein OQA88_1567 [Cercophora sp. LCS_1]
MNLQATLGRGTASLESTCRIAAARSSSVPTRGRQLFSTTSSALADDKTNTSKNRLTSRERSRAAASQIGRLSGNGNAALRSTRPGAGGIDARSLGNAFTKGPVDASKVVSLRSLRGGFRGRGRGGLSSSNEFSRQTAGSTGSFRSGSPSGFGRSTSPTGFGRGGGGFRGGRGGMAGRGRGGASARGRGGGAGASGARTEKKKREDNKSGPPQAKPWSAEQKELMSKWDKGEVMEYTPKAGHEELFGYGPAVPSDSKLGKMESALRTMRVMGGVASFNKDSGVTVDDRAAWERYHKDKKPLFFNSKEERDWLKLSQADFPMAAPEPKTTQTIVDLAVVGKYQAKGFVERDNTLGTVENYTSRTWYYRTSDSERFLAKVKSLLPAEAQGGPAPKEKRA